jgi:hypothetical protein
LGVLASFTIRACKKKKNNEKVYEGRGEHAGGWEVELGIIHYTF